jgi:FtsP/CotA-like multicopper oxidase with cupredoxin domain
MSQFKRRATVGAVLTGFALLNLPGAMAAPLPGGTLDPTTIPKYVTPLVIPPVMNNAIDNQGTPIPNDYDIAVRQFQQQILPGGIWATLNPDINDPLINPTGPLPPTTVWSYGPAADPAPTGGVAPAANSQFNYPAYTIENTTNTGVTVDWINDLVDHTTGTWLPHLLPVDQTLHWANPGAECAGPVKKTDCRGVSQAPYAGPVPIITHVHGAHVGPESDGYPEAWWLPNPIDAGFKCANKNNPKKANNIDTFVCSGTLANAYNPKPNTDKGVGSFTYLNDQPSTTLWYHDHTLGMTRSNVYAGPAGFWLIRDPNAPNGGETGLVTGILPFPAPVAGQGVLALNVPGDPVRASIREIPVVIQDRSFNADGSLFYPDNRAFFEGLPVSDLQIPFIGDPANIPSDISPIWNPEAFFNVMVVNGVSWPTLEVEPDLYRLRLLNGCNSRFLNLSLQALDANGVVLGEVPFNQIGAEQSLMPKVVEVTTGFKTVLPGDGTIPAPTAASDPDEALLMGLAERADTIVDFSNLPAGTARVRMINTAPDAPFGGFGDDPADPGTTGQVMEFALVANTPVGDGFTAPQDLVLSLPDPLDPANSATPFPGARDLALIEEESILICASVDLTGAIIWDPASTPDPANPGTCVDTTTGLLAASLPFAPKAAVLGINGSTGGTVTLWSDPIETRPALDATETWELWNWTVDGHPIHLHLVKFKVVNREAFDPLTGALSGAVKPPEATETGWKDTVISYPGEVTRVNATFDIAGLYVWHCHIVEHEDNEMMVPFCVANGPGCDAVP